MRWIVTTALAVAGVIVLRRGLIFAFESSAGVPAFLSALFVTFGLLFLAFAATAWRQKKWGYFAGAILSIVFVALEGDRIVLILSNPADASFLEVLPAISAAIAAILYGFYGFYVAKRPSENPRQISRSAVLALIVLGFVIGGMTVGVIAGAAQSAALASAAVGKDITIAIGASNVNNGQFYVPATFTVNVGTKVTWFNGDTTAHTVTSDDKTFDSGNMNSGATFQFTFTKAGTYTYTCSYHPFMKGTIVVK